MSAPPFCIACGRSDTFVPALNILARCVRCGFVTWPEAGTVDPSGLYDEKYFTELDYPDYVGNESSLRRSMARHLQQMAHFGSGGGDLLEIGCAYGFFLDEARRHFRRVVGVDVAVVPAHRAHQRFGVETRAGDFLEMEFPPASFDVVCLWDTVEHLSRPDLFAEKARRLTRPGGRLFLTTADVDSWMARRRGAKWRQIHPPSHLHYFSRRSMTVMLERVGFQVLGFETAGYYHSLHNILASLALRRGAAAGASRAALQTIGEGLARRLGLWINLGDIMFVAAEPGASAAG